MFQSITYSHNGKYCPIYTIIDSDFQEQTDYEDEDWVEAIIEVYSRRNLNVALNLFLFMQYENKEWGDDFSIDDQISTYKKDIKDFEKYIPDINKYLGLI